MNDRKRQIITVARELFIKNGVITTSVQDIIDATEISKGTFYNYFSSKNACLIAILEHGYDETFLRRREILSGQDISNKEVLVKQISIHMLVTREHNLVPIFQAVHHSGDQDLKTSVRRYQLEELAWLTERLIDVYGEKSATVAPDCAVMMYGIIQHLMHIGTNWSKQEIVPTELVDFAMRRVDAIMADMIDGKDIFLEKDIFLNAHINQQIYTKQEILMQMTAFNQLIKNKAKSEDYQFISFLLDEIQSESPRISIIKSVNRSFREAFTGTDYQHQAEELATNIWGYIDTLKSQ